MDNRKALLIVNPISGTRSKQGLEKLVAERLKVKGIEVESYVTKGGGEAFKVARKAAENGFEAVITAGGDGTVNEAANGVAHTSTILGILPYGSGNGLARSLGIPQDLNEALKIIEGGFVLNSDRGLANNHPFYCTFGMGFDAVVSEKFASMKKRGRITYIRSAFREYLNYQSQPYALVMDGRTLTEKALLIAICNAPQYGNNAYIGPKAKLTDGLLDITVVHSDNPFSTMIMGMDLMTGMLDKNRSIESFQVPAVTIVRTSDGPVHLDGEPMQMKKKIVVECEKEALKVYAPEKERPFRPFISPLRAMLDDMRYDVMDKFRQIDKKMNEK